MPWGPSASINEARLLASSDGKPFMLEIEMQSGDTIRVEAGAFSFRDGPCEVPPVTHEK